MKRADGQIDDCDEANNEQKSHTVEHNNSRDKIILVITIIKKDINAHRTDLLELPLSFPTHFDVCRRGAPCLVQEYSRVVIVKLI